MDISSVLCLSLLVYENRHTWKVERSALNFRFFYTLPLVYKRGSNKQVDGRTDGQDA